MLYLHPPYYTYDDVVVLADYHDPRQFYYFPNRPHIALDEQNRPAIRFLIYREALDDLDPNSDDVAGFLFFDTVLSYPQAKLDKVAQRIQEDLELDDLPRLSPLLYRGGNVRLTFLDRKTVLPDEEPGGPGTPGGGQPEEEPKEEWVTFLESSGMPSLYGENRAIFSAQMTKKATALLFGAFEGFIPAGVVYELDFVGMQRAFNVKVTADWEQIYHSELEKFTTSFIVFNSDIENLVEELIDKKVIKIEGTIEGVGEEGMESEFNEVRKMLQDFVTEKFFKAQPNPLKPDTEVVDGIVDFTRRMRNLASAVNVGYTRKTLDISEIRSFSADYTIARAVERKIAPQAHLSVFFEDLGVTRDDIVTVVDGEDDLWRSIDFNIQANADFEGDGLFEVLVDLAYGHTVDDKPTTETRIRSARLTNTAQGASFAAWYQPQIGMAHLHRYRPVFRSTAIPGPSGSLDSGWIPGEGNLITVTPTDLYARRQVEFQLIRKFPFDVIPQVQINLRYTDPLTGWRYIDSEVLDESRTHHTFAFRTRQGAPSDVEYQFMFHGDDIIESEWQKTVNDFVLIDDPRQLMKVRIMVGGDRSKIMELMLDFRYEDEDNGILETWTTRYDATTINEPREWVFVVADPTKTRYAYNQTILDTDGNMFSTDWVQDDRSTLPVGFVFAKRWDIQPELIGPELSTNGIERITVNLEYEDETNDYESRKQLTFSAPGKGEKWSLELRDPSLREYSYVVRYFLTTGFEKKLGPVVSSDTFLMIPSTPPA